MLKEYNHGCAICLKNSPAPELHHIDGNPANNDPLNILPLCPNCHNSKLNPRILAVFRRHNVREVLSAQFEQLFNKATTLLDLSPGDYYVYLPAYCSDLVSFVGTLENGKYYAPKLEKLLRSIPEPDQETPEGYKSFHKLRSEQVIALLVELLPFQGWRFKTLPER